jgi:hypothetical protein
MAAVRGELHHLPRFYRTVLGRIGTLFTDRKAVPMLKLTRRRGPPLNAVIANGPCPIRAGGRVFMLDRHNSFLAVPGNLPAAPCEYCADGSEEGGGADCWPPERLAHLYLCRGLSTYGIGELTGLDRQRVTRMLRRAGVPLRPRGAGRFRPVRRTADPPGHRSSWRSCMKSPGSAQGRSP